MENEKCNFGVEWSSASLEQQIRQIVREEIAAHEERRHQEVIDFLAATAELVRGTSESRL